MAEKKISLTLSVKESGKEARKLSFAQDSVTVGGSETADLPIQGDKVSDIHAMFDMSRGDEVYLMDLGSSSGTFVNEKKVNKQKLEAGDAIAIGDATIEIVSIGEPAADAPAPVVAKPAAPEPAKPVEPAPAAVEAPVAQPVDTTAEEKRALEEKKAIFEAQKKKKSKEVALYDLEVVPKEHKAPDTKEPLFEAREIVWGSTLLRINHFKAPRILTAGEKKSCDYFLSSEYLPTETFNLVSAAGGNWAINFTKQMEGWTEDSGHHTTFHDLIDKKKCQDMGGYYQVQMTPGMAALFQFDAISYYYRFVTPERLDTVPITKRIDYPITSLFTVFFLFYTLFVIYLKSLPAPEVADILDAPERFAKLILEPMDLEEPPPPPEEEKKIMKESGEKAIGEEGKIGKKESLIDKTEGSAKKRLEDEKVANSSGILGALDQGMENMDRIFGGGGLGAGLDKNLGMLEGISGLDMRGAGGLGSRGSGMGGGGMALGIGGLGTRGRGGSGAGGSSAYGIGAAGNLKKRASDINIATGNPTIAGSLDKSIIARIIKKHYSQIKYCYQKELNKNPKLYGKITIKFTISPNGTVSSSVVSVTTMKNVAVEECVAKTIKRIVFPAPKGGGIVVVTYPFIFKAEGV